MKSIVFSAAAVLAMSSFAVAGGDITPIEEPVAVEVPEVVALDAEGGFYLGLGYGSVQGEEDYNFNPGSGNVSITEESRDFDQLLLQAGYQINEYVAVEGRYWAGMNDLNGDFYYEDSLYNQDNSLDAWGIYVKPMYPVTAELDAYALLGYATTTLTRDVYVGSATVSNDTDLDGFSWGLGVSYTFNDNIIIFADYVSLYNDTVDYDVLSSSSDFTIDTVNVGVSYKF